MKNIFLLLLMFISILMTSCKVLFTTDLKKRIELNNEIGLSKVQFYNSKKIVLFRELNSVVDRAAKGKIKLVNGKYLEYIKIRKHTPCKYVNNNGESLNIAFDENSKNFLVFNISYPNYYEIYSFNLESKVKEYRFFNKILNSSISTGKVIYDTNTYFIINGIDAKLKIKKNQRHPIEKQKRTLQGIKID